MRLIKLISLLLLAALSGCTSTVHPVLVQPRQASYSGNEQNSGVISETKGAGGVVDQHFHDRYFALFAKWGKSLFITSENQFVALPNGTFSVTSQILADKIFMELVERSGMLSHQ